jgi:hypothetical protein
VENGGKLVIRKFCQRAEESAQGTKSTATTSTTKDFSRSFYWLCKNKFISCCDDECCESVQTSATPAPSKGWDKNVLCVQCAYLGYFLQISQAAGLRHFSILKIQQNIRAISKACAQ